LACAIDVPWTSKSKLPTRPADVVGFDPSTGPGPARGDEPSQARSWSAASPQGTGQRWTGSTGATQPGSSARRLAHPRHAASPDAHTVRRTLDPSVSQRLNCSPSMFRSCRASSASFRPDRRTDPQRVVRSVTQPAAYDLASRASPSSSETCGLQPSAARCDAGRTSGRWRPAPR